MNNLSKDWFYRLGDEDTGTGFLWSGIVRMTRPVSEKQAKHLIRNKINRKRLPVGSIVISARELMNKGNR